jgi:hypothetical protein
MAATSESEALRHIEKFFKKTSGDVNAQFELFNTLIRLCSLGNGILAITAHDESDCDVDDCLIGSPAIQYIERISYMSQLCEDCWWSGNGASVIFCKKAADVSDITVEITKEEGKTVISYSAKLLEDTIHEKIWCYVVYNSNTNALEYHFVDETIGVSDNHPIFIAYAGCVSVEPLIRTVCTKYSAEHFISEFGDVATHTIEDDHFLAINT